MSCSYSTASLGWLGVMLCLALPVRGAQAQAGSGSTGILRGTGRGVPAELARAIDEALLRELASAAHIEHPIVSPADFDALQLTVGCDGESRECLAAVAHTLQTDAIVVRRLAVDATGLTTLDLLYYEPNRSSVAAARATVPAGSRSELSASMPTLVRKLFGIEPEPAATRAAAPAAIEPASTAAVSPPAQARVEPVQQSRHGEPDADQPTRIGTWTWVSLISGTTVLGVGAVVGVSAASSFDDLKKTEIVSTTDAQHVHRDFDSIETRAGVANVLMPLGGAVLALGSVLLALDLSRDAPADQDVASSLDIVPVRGGAMLTLRRRLGSF